MRTKQQHLQEIDKIHMELKRTGEMLARLRMNVPTGSYVHKRLKDSENDLHQLRRDLEFTFHTLDQNGYGETAAKEVAS